MIIAFIGVVLLNINVVWSEKVYFDGEKLWKHMFIFLRRQAGLPSAH